MKEDVGNDFSQPDLNTNNKLRQKRGLFQERFFAEIS